MARRQRGMQSIPNALNQGKNVFPVTPFRAQLDNGSVGAANNEREVLELNLQFEDNEVLDVWAVEYSVYWDASDIAAFDDLVVSIGLFEDPDKPATTDLITEAVVEDDSSLVHIYRCGWTNDFATSGMTSQHNVQYLNYNFVQPYTVARNLAVIAQLNGVEGNSQGMISLVTVWGRRRNASDAEFKNIIYRQRF